MSLHTFFLYVHVIGGIGYSAGVLIGMPGLIRQAAPARTSEHFAQLIVSLGASSRIRVR